MTIATYQINVSGIINKWAHRMVAQRVNVNASKRLQQYRAIENRRVVDFKMAVTILRRQIRALKLASHK